MKPSSAKPPGPNKSLTAELERLEQSITLTLQEIDHNFSKCHRIIVGSILPEVERYACSSKDVWKRSVFWKQFFETSANVSLSGYEELANPEEDNTSASYSHMKDESKLIRTFTSSFILNESSEENYSPARQQSTPIGVQRHGLERTREHPWADINSPYEHFKDDFSDSFLSNNKSLSANGSKPLFTERIRDSPVGLDHSPGLGLIQQSDPILTTRTPVPPVPPKEEDRVLLHRVLNNKWTIQATPKAGKSRVKKESWSRQQQDISIPSSSSFEQPSLQSRIFHDTQITEKVSRRLERQSGSNSDSDSDTTSLPVGMSPPVTVQFSLPEMNIIRTPARLVARGLVDDILKEDITSPDEEINTPPLRHDLSGNF